MTEIINKIVEAIKFVSVYAAVFVVIISPVILTHHFGYAVASTVYGISIAILFFSLVIGAALSFDTQQAIR